MNKLADYIELGALVIAMVVLIGYIIVVVVT